MRVVRRRFSAHCVLMTTSIHRPPPLTISLVMIATTTSIQRSGFACARALPVFIHSTSSLLLSILSWCLCTQRHVRVRRSVFALTAPRTTSSSPRMSRPSITFALLTPALPPSARPSHSTSTTHRHRSLVQLPPHLHAFPLSLARHLPLSRLHPHLSIFVRGV